MVHARQIQTASILLVLPLFVNQASASLDLLAGVEAGIETRTAMTNPDLDLTQKILSTQKAETSHTWFNQETGVTYQIHIKNHYTYGSYPCLAYELSISQANKTDIKSLDACQHQTGKWISVSPVTMPL